MFKRWNDPLTLSLSLVVAVAVSACGGDSGASTASAGDSTGSVTTGEATDGPVTTSGPSSDTVPSGSDSKGESESDTKNESESDTKNESESDTKDESESDTKDESESDTKDESESESESESDTQGDLCAGFEEPGCNKTGCPEGQVCQAKKDPCVPSECKCDPQTGEETCSDDCDGGVCVPGCEPVVCQLFCEHGFKKDKDGCEICECNDAPDDLCGCTEDKDCVKTSSGCCACNEGGDEVAAAIQCIDQVHKCDLPPDEVFCLQVYLCTDVKPACVKGECVLQ